MRLTEHATNNSLHQYLPTRRKWQPLLIAAKESHVKVARLLSIAGTAQNLQSQGATALFFVTHRGHTEVSQLLCDAGADMSQAATSSQLVSDDLFKRAVSFFNFSCVTNTHQRTHGNQRAHHSNKASGRGLTRWTTFTYSRN